jgi:Putative prokaryotic signal transducing protein
MRIVYRAQNLIDAHLVKDALENAEVPAFITGEYLTGGVGQLPAMDYVAVLVPDSSIDIAEPIVREIDHALTQAQLAIQELDDDTGDLLPATG